MLSSEPDRADLDRALDRYFAAIRSRSMDQICSAFTPDAVLIGPAGLYQGRRAIGDYYLENNLRAGSVHIKEGTRYYAGRGIAMEILLTLDDKTLRLGDFFEIKDGLISRLNIYMR